MNPFAIFILFILHQVLDSVNFSQLRNLGPGKFGQSYLWKFLLLIILSIAPISKPGQMPSNEIHKHLRLHRFQVGHEMITKFDSTTSGHIQVAHGSPRLPTSQTSGAGGLQDFQKKIEGRGKHQKQGTFGLLQQHAFLSLWTNSGAPSVWILVTMGDHDGNPLDFHSLRHLSRYHVHI